MYFLLLDSMCHLAAGNRFEGFKIRIKPSRILFINVESQQNELLYKNQVKCKLLVSLQIFYLIQ